jgi:hypothetical protein
VLKGRESFRFEERDPKSLAGALFFATFAILLFGGAYAIWPSGVFSNPFSEMTIAVLLRGVASLTLAIVGLEFLGALAIVALSDT